MVKTPLVSMACQKSTLLVLATQVDVLFASERRWRNAGSDQEAGHSLPFVGDRLHTISCASLMERDFTLARCTLVQQVGAAGFRAR